MTRKLPACGLNKDDDFWLRRCLDVTRSIKTHENQSLKSPTSKCVPRFLLDHLPVDKLCRVANFKPNGLLVKSRYFRKNVTVTLWRRWCISFILLEWERDEIWAGIQCWVWHSVTNCSVRSFPNRPKITTIILAAYFYPAAGAKVNFVMHSGS